MQEYKIDLRVTRDFNRALFAARLNRIRAWILRQPRDLLPFEDVYARLVIRGRHDRGYQTVPLNRILGSLGRFRDFDRSFLPLTDHSEDRWKRINRSYYEDRALPPVELYELGEIYFVGDGNHRVSVARERGQIVIDARIIEFDVDVTLNPALEPAGLSAKEEQSDFFAWTDLARLRPGCDINISTPGGYLDLILHINRHRRRLKAEHPSHLSRDEAVTHWYDHVYVPTVTAIRQTRLPVLLRRRSMADLYVSVANQQLLLATKTGQDVSLDEALGDYLRQFNWRMRWARAWRSVIVRLLTRTPRRAKPS